MQPSGWAGPLTSPPQIAHRQPERGGEVNPLLGSPDLCCPWIERPADRDLGRQVGDAEEVRPLPMSELWEHLAEVRDTGSVRVGARQADREVEADDELLVRFHSQLRAQVEPVGHRTRCSRRPSVGHTARSDGDPTFARIDAPVRVSDDHIDSREAMNEVKPVTSARFDAPPLRTSDLYRTYVCIRREVLLRCDLRLPLRFTDHSDWRLR